MPSAQTSTERVLRAPWNFEYDYSNIEGKFPILFTYPAARKIPPAGQPDLETALDPEAKQAVPPSGVSPLLARFTPVPMGATACVYFPIIYAPTANFFYVWRVIFRTRSVADYVRRKQARIRYSIGISRLGASDTRAGTVPDRPSLSIAGPRSVRPSTSEAIIFNRSEPVEPSVTDPIFAQIRSDAVAISTSESLSPLPAFYPGSQSGYWGAQTDTFLDYEQGEYDPATVYQGGSARAGITHLPKFVKCMGDEMAVECFKFNSTSTGVVGTARNWDFEIDEGNNVVGGEDHNFSIRLGVGARGLEPAREPPVDTGVRVIFGTFPA